MKQSLLSNNPYNLMADIKVSYIKRLVTTNTNYFFPKK